ncbi:MAG TPA: KpsF/GutQ family sugar-phosphate isomerase [Candidatus Marinimicrobia bacterium]|nr:KpsF/GutQ family sugar-phosphate isomerase [Candidatus Neomarinimicrobiota bacterium]
MPEPYLKIAKELIRAESFAIAKLEDRIDDNFARIVELLYRIRGKVIITGVGKSGLVGRKIAATLASTGTPSFFIHAYEAGHGDIGSVSQNDALIVISNSGETSEVLNLLPYLKKKKVLVVGFVGNVQSSLGKKCDIVINTGVSSEACPMGIVPTASTIVTLAMGDALAIALMNKRKFKELDFAGLHPGGSLGRRLLTTVEDLMHTGDEIPLATINDSMKQVLFTMTQKGLGVVGILDQSGRLVGVITDGDLRRGLEQTGDFFHQAPAAIMSRNPKFVNSQTLAIDALYQMEKYAVTNLFVFNGKQTGIPTGIIHIHDILRYGIMVK